MNARGIYVELPIRAPMQRIWQLTQTPELHQRWDLRFSSITYLPKTTDTQHFLYSTRIGFGLAINGTGESIATRSDHAGNATSSLRFFSHDPKSLIQEGSGYWQYLQHSSQITFLTWYDYQTRFGLIGRAVDKLIFRPAMGWATAWSFDRLRLWSERDQSPEASLAFALIHAAVRIAIAFVWVWHGLVPKLIAHHHDELTMLAQSGLSADMLPWVGAGEVLFGLVTLILWRHRSIFLINASLMAIALVAVALRSPEYLSAAFNPVTLNLGVIALSVIGYLASPFVPFASNCRRSPPKKNA